MEWCREERCGLYATHGVYFRPGRGQWHADKRGDLPIKAPIMYCSWHATVQAVKRNAEKAGVWPNPSLKS